MKAQAAAFPAGNPGRPRPRSRPRPSWSARVILGIFAFCRRKPGAALAALAALAGVGAISANALFLQTGRHPAPLFQGEVRGPATAAIRPPARPAEIIPAAEPAATPVVTGSTQAHADPVPAAPRAAPKAAEKPASKPATAKVSAKASEKPDPIGDLIRQDAIPPRRPAQIH